MFTPAHIKIFMGGDFALEKQMWTSHTLAQKFENWAKELKRWGDVPLSEVSIDADRIHVTIENGIPQ